MGIQFDRARLLADGVPAADRDRRERALKLAEAAIAEVEPERATRRALEGLRSRGESLEGATVFAWGKASVPMARAAVDAVDPSGGIVVALSDAALPGLEVRLGAHPDPAPDALETGRAFLRRAQALERDDVALCLVSGGGSALLELPREGVSLETIQHIGRALRERGADIGELNAVRRALSRLKGGGLAMAMAPARVRNVILSDVPGHPPNVVASGATCPPPGEPDARAVLERHRLWDDLDAGVREVIGAPPAWDEDVDIRTELAGDNRTARRAVCDAAGAIVDRPIVDREGFFDGEARALGERLAAETPEHAWVWGGETTVRVTGDGVGGRNQEVPLGALAAGWRGGLLLCVGTDGADGASDAAGALIDPHAVAEARRLGLDPRDALANNDATPFFDAIGATLRCGRTGTNVADLCLYLP